MLVLLIVLVSLQIADTHISFVKSWMDAHIEDTEKYLGMPVVFSEFDTLISTVYSSILNSTKKGGSGAGSLLWQVFFEGMDNMDDGYAIVFSKSPSTSSIVTLQSTRLALFNSLCSTRCNWSCKKKKMLEKILYHDEL
ncbi:mannan endo-1,4-beta-mannosidase [Medicago truncatula]|uniref:Mannan endo-1,4-beta-mannosidase n=1 Tax=Medicago truncatula TaxID=3880 RepID=G7KY58_MEDTR|nr:mannan endo-1,4-beta-mannosidase [Medicago truncatula]